MIRILIIDNQPIVGEGTKSLLSNIPEFDVEFVAQNNDTSKILKRKKYDVYLFELNMPGKNGLELTKELMLVNPQAKVIIITGYDISSHFNYMVNAGVSGFISKASSKRQLIQTVWSALDGYAIIPIDLLAQLRKPLQSVNTENGNEISLTDREHKILISVSQGKTNEELADLLFMSKRNVERNLTKIFEKMKVKSRAEAISKANELNLLPEVTIKSD